jgi:GH18 family chitinase
MGFSQDYSHVPDWVEKPEGYQTGAMVKYEGNVFIANFWASKPGEGDPNENGWRLHDELYDVTSSPAAEPARIIGYIPTWRNKEGFDYADEEMYLNITHGIISFLMFDRNNLGEFESKSVDDVNAVLRDVVLTGHRCETKISIALGGAVDYGFLYLMEHIGNNPDDPVLQKAVKNVVDFVESNGLDGVDLDLECWWDENNDASKDQGGRLKSDGAHPAGKGLTEFAKQLKQAMPDKIISAALFATSWYGNCYDPGLAKYVEWLGIMTYDLTGSWNQSPVGPQTALLKIREQKTYAEEQQGEWPGNRKSSGNTTDPMSDNPILSVEDSLWYWTNPFFTNWQGTGQNLKRNKIAAGVPIYGYDFAYGKEPDDLSGQVAPGYKTIRYKDLLSQFSDAPTAANGNIKVPGNTPRPPFVSVAGTYPYAHNIYFETPKTGVDKLNFLKSVGVQGVIIWELTNDVWEGGESLVKALYQNSGNPEKQAKEVELLPNDEVENGAKSPAVAVNDEGIAVKVYQKDGKMYIRVGQQTEEGFVWLAEEVEATDSGSEPSLAMNNRGYVVLVYEGSDDELFYRIGRASSSGFWWTGAAQKYGQGIRPYVTLSNGNLVIETHQKGFEIWSQQLVYSTGNISGSTINFLKQDQDYVNGREPAMTVVEQDGATTVVEVHMSEGALETLWARVGDVQSDGSIDWGSDSEYDTGKHASIAATNDGYIVAVHRSDGTYAKLWYRIGQLNRSAKQVEWITQQAIAYSTGEYPYVSLARNQENYILLEAHGADVFDGNLVDKDKPPEFVSMRGSIPLVHELLEESNFFARVSVDLGSHGLCVSDDGEELYRCELEIGPSRAEAFFEPIKLALGFIPFIGSLVSIIENSIACRDGEQDGCVGLGIDAAFLALEIIPGGAFLKMSGKAGASAIGGMTRATRRVPVDDVIRDLDKANVGALGRWWQKRQEARDRISLEQAFPCLASNLTLMSEPSASSLRSIAAVEETQPDPNILDITTRAVERAQPDPDILDITTRQTLIKQYNAFIKKLRDDFNHVNLTPDGKRLSGDELKRLETRWFSKHIKMGDEMLELKFRRSDLYLDFVNDTDIREVGRYPKAEERGTASLKDLQNSFKDLSNGNFGNDGIASKPLTLFAHFLSEASRIGPVRQMFYDKVIQGGETVNLKDYSGAVNGWSDVNAKIATSNAGSVVTKKEAPKQVGIADSLKFNGNGRDLDFYYKCGEHGIEVRRS